MRFALIPAAVPVHPCSPLHAGVRVTSKQHNALLLCETSACRSVMPGTFAMGRRSVI